MNRHIIFLGFVSLLFSVGASAAQRMVYFSAVGRNTISSTSGLDYTAKGTCTLTITNPSASIQTFTLTSTATPAGSPTATPNGGASCTGLSCTLAATQSATISWDFGDQQAGPTTQTVSCSGSILGADQTATNPGFLVAGGTLVTFVESQFKSTYETTKTSVNRQPIYSQTPISVNSGKPF